MMWPGSDFKYNGTACTFSWTFDMNRTWESRVDEVMLWFTHKTTPTNLVMLYIEEPDSLGHPYGPESDKVNNI